jgi:integrase
MPRDISGGMFPITAVALRGLWRRACKRANIDNLHFHDLRYEATSRFFEKGLNVIEVAPITGHKDLRTLQRYTHLRAEDLAKKPG